MSVSFKERLGVLKSYLFGGKKKAMVKITNLFTRELLNYGFVDKKEKGVESPDKLDLTTAVGGTIAVVGLAWTSSSSGRAETGYVQDATGYSGLEYVRTTADELEQIKEPEKTPELKDYGYEGMKRGLPEYVQTYMASNKKVLNKKFSSFEKAFKEAQPKFASAFRGVPAELQNLVIMETGVYQYKSEEHPEYFYEKEYETYTDSSGKQKKRVKKVNGKVVYKKGANGKPIIEKVEVRQDGKVYIEEKRAFGPWAIMNYTGVDYGLRMNVNSNDLKIRYAEWLDWNKSSQVAVKILCDHYMHLHSWDLAVMAYNCGRGSSKKRTGVLGAMSKAGVQVKESYTQEEIWNIWQYLPTETKNYYILFLVYSEQNTYAKSDYTVKHHDEILKTTSFLQSVGTGNNQSTTKDSFNKQK